ncbi:DUF2732 family protein [Pectobacteriaceae bacterium CE70]|uniref:DUF2732 family protein n=1 Tax=Serratia sp. (strain ATCC 39006) TaxID=104623 RepID=UPI0003923A30|nr:DUF2732 family protein [Serratia sp. ATCC 39006]WJV64403.1 DUF2732 family protein [Pectobacteriaceae bacterium C52]WJV65164.1 DUF2732 family protein [Pectobacteriaceae bacterium CE70]WJY09179.1 DUF2732 family protein [Pectobacteriaceae bacterium C80]
MKNQSLSHHYQPQAAFDRALITRREELLSEAARFYAGYLKQLAAHAQHEHLSAPDIVELLCLEAEKIQHQVGERC